MKKIGLLILSLLPLFTAISFAGEAESLPGWEVGDNFYYPKYQKFGEITKVTELGAEIVFDLNWQRIYSVDRKQLGEMKKEIEMSGDFHAYDRVAHEKKDQKDKVLLRREGTILALFSGGTALVVFDNGSSDGEALKVQNLIPLPPLPESPRSQEPISWIF